MTMTRLDRMRRLGVVVVSAAIVMIPVGSCASRGETVKHAAYCAIMPDSVGLYVGNPITHMGFQIGKVTAITPEITSVRVDFTVDGRITPPADVKAVTRSTSILADRALELVGDFESGPALAAGGCIPIDRSSTPKSLSEVIGSATTFMNAITPQGSTNIGDVVGGIDQAVRHNGAGINQLLTTSSAVLDAPDEAIGDIGSIITNLAQLTSTLREIRGPLKQALLDAQQTTPNVVKATTGAHQVLFGATPIVAMISDLEIELGDETQETLDTLEAFLRKASAHSTFLASLLKPGPVIINWLENHVNNKAFNIRYRPPLYRIPTDIDGLLVCGAMNASMPGSCSDVAGKPYAVDVALLQYVLTEANRR
jgi:virulence factor Mce-like protein